MNEAVMNEPAVNDPVTHDPVTNASRLKRVEDATAYKWEETTGA
jgi:hypothetical protein